MTEIDERVAPDGTAFTDEAAWRRARRPTGVSPSAGEGRRARQPLNEVPMKLEHYSVGAVVTLAAITIARTILDAQMRDSTAIRTSDVLASSTTGIFDTLLAITAGVFLGAILLVVLAGIGITVLRYRRWRVHDEPGFDDRRIAWAPDSAPVRRYDGKRHDGPEAA